MTRSITDPSTSTASDERAGRLELPAYLVSDVARYLGRAPQVVGQWTSGKTAVIAAPRPSGQPLSYMQLVESSVITVFRGLGVSLQRIRKAHLYLRQTFNIQHPFAQLQLKTNGAHVIKSIDDPELSVAPVLIADEYGQEAWGELITERLDEFDYAKSGLASRWWLRGRERQIVIDPNVSFGMPSIERTGVATWAIAGRVNSGESVYSVAEDFQITEMEVQDAVDFELEIAA